MRWLERRREFELGVRIAVGIIAHFEGGMSPDGRYHAYWDPNGRVWTLGHGETRNVRPGMVWTKRKADRMLRRRLRRDFAPTLFALKLPLRRHQVAAVLSLMWNEGPGIIGPSHDIGIHLRARNWTNAAASFDEYVKAGAPLRTLPGLVIRRNAEQALFLTDLPPKK